MPISLPDQIKCVEREIMMRKRVYPAWVDAKRMTEDRAGVEIATMTAALKTLQWLYNNRESVKAAYVASRDAAPTAAVDQAEPVDSNRVTPT